MTSDSIIVITVLKDTKKVHVAILTSEDPLGWRECKYTALIYDYVTYKTKLQKYFELK